MDVSIERVAVIGSGVMGSALAAHFANAGVPALLLDIVPPEGMNVDGDPASPGYRNALATAGRSKALKSKPPSFFTAAGARLVSVGNLEDDLERLNDVDWVLEAIIEKLDVKKSLFTKIAPHLKGTAVLTTNTSGLSITDMAESLPDPLKPRFFGTHFFNPPRYLRLLELVPHAATDAGILEAIATFGEEILGKGIVVAKDTPNFIANRIGVHWVMTVFRAIAEGDYTIEEVDALTGPAIGRPKSATFRTADLVGLDTLVHVSQTVYDRAAEDECRDYFKPPEYVARMVENGLLGEKTGAGFYRKTKKNGKTEIQTLDLGTFDYRDQKKSKFPSVDAAKSVKNTGERIAQLVKGKDRAARFLWNVISDSLLYSARRLGEISDDVVAIDRAMKWGFGWDLGPFELWDGMGVEKTAERLRQEGREIPEIVEAVLRTPEKTFYHRDEKYRQFHFSTGHTREEVKVSPAVIDLTAYKANGGLVKKNAGASLVDIGDGILCLEFHSKMNAIGEDVISMMLKAVKETEANFAGLVIGNQGKSFSVGANLMLLLLEAQDGNWEEIDLMVRAFQKANMALKYCSRPVVAAPFGITLAGGCEVCLSTGHIYASAESYMGLVEIGVGLIPAGGGCKEMLMRNLEGLPPIDGTDVFPYARAAFEAIGMARVSMSAEDARTFKVLRKSDGVAMNPDRLLYSAKAMALGLAAQGYRRPDPTIEVPVAGESGIAAIKTQLYNMHEGGFISEYDRYLGGELAGIICGGALPAGTKVSEQYLLELERVVFLRLCGQPKTRDRIKHMLKTGKPLRN